MFLKKIKLHNFRGFSDMELDFHKELTLIVGVNGSGKTSILEGIAIAMSSLFVKMDGLVARKIDKEQAHLKSYTLGSSQDVQAQYPVIVEGTALIENKEILWSRSLNSSKGQTSYADAKDIINVGIKYQADVRNGSTTLNLPILAYYGTGRLWDYHREKQIDVFETNNRLNGYLDCFDGTANVKLMMNWFSKMTIQKYQNQELGKGGVPELEAVFSAMTACYKRITGYDDIKIQYNIGTKELDIAYRNNEEEYMRISMNQLSDGYKGMISLVADIAYRMAVLNPQLLGNVCSQTEGIILIDEIDLHLHPAWQQRIVEDLRAIFPKVQFILTTHAPVVISSVSSENLLLLEEGDIYEPSGEVHGKDTNTIIRSVMKANERPIRIKELFLNFYKCIDEKNISDAEKYLSELEKQIGSDDAELAGCRVKLKLLSIRR